MSAVSLGSILLAATAITATTIMNSDWQTFLLTQGFELTASKQLQLENRPAKGHADDLAENLPLLIDLSHFQMVDVTGEEASSFLQGQFSNDINALSADTTYQLNAYCNPKGRMFALFHCLKTEHGYRLVAPADVMQKVLPRLKMFVMRSKVTIEASTASLIAVQQCPKLDAPDVNLAAVKQMGDLSLVHGPIDALQTLWQSLSSHQAADQYDWTRLEIQAGMPQIYPANIEKLIPQQINVDLCQGLNFKKGCFPGQEIIARIRYLGKPKTRMIAVESDVKAEVGDPIFIEGREQAAGIVINQSRALDGKHLLAITVPPSHIESGQLKLQTNNTALQRIALPYPIPDASV